MQTTAVEDAPKLPEAITLYGSPVSNYTARCRYLIYRRSLTHAVEIGNPMTLGGIKSETFLRLNPLGKMPALFLPSGSSLPAIYESSAICNYIARQFDVAPNTPSFIPTSPEDQARSDVIVNLLDVYLGQLHPYMYKRDVAGTREEGIAKMAPIFDAIESTMDDNGPYCVGSELSVADCCLWGNWPFYDFMLPTLFGVDPTENRPKLKKWRDFMATESEAAKTVYNEVFTALQGWWDNDRWVKLGIPALKSRPESTV